MKALDKWILGLVLVGVLFLGVAGFILSYDSLYNTAVWAGINPELADLFPWIVEGFTAIATLAAYVLRGTGRAVYPWILAITAFSFSLYANAHGELSFKGAVRAVPVIAIPASVHLMIVIKAHFEKVAAAAVDAEATVFLGDTQTEELAPVEGTSEEAPKAKKAQGPVIPPAARSFFATARAVKSPQAKEYWLAKAHEAMEGAPA